jgi:hypothetical protein
MRGIDTSGNTSRNICIRRSAELCQYFAGGSCYLPPRETGAYYRIPDDEPVVPENAVSYDRTADPAVVSDSTARAIDFLKQFAKGRYVILINVPHPATKTGNAEAIAAGVGLPLIAPNLDGLNTSDGYHLDRPSAERWSKAFLEAEGPEIRSCLEKHGAGS